MSAAKYQASYEHPRVQYLRRAQSLLARYIPASRLFGNSALALCRRLMGQILKSLDPVRSSAQISDISDGQWVNVPLLNFVDDIAEDTASGYDQTCGSPSNSWDAREHKRKLVATLTGLASAKVSPSALPRHADRGVAIGVRIGSVNYAVDPCEDFVS